MNLCKAAFPILAVFLANLACAHAKMVSSVPADGDFVSSPDVVVLTFDSRVRLTGVELHTVDGDTVDLGELGEAIAKSFEIRLPKSLPRGEYYLVWRSIAADKHFSTGEFFFTVVSD